MLPSFALQISLLRDSEVHPVSTESGRGEKRQRWIKRLKGKVMNQGQKEMIVLGIRKIKHLASEKL